MTIYEFHERFAGYLLPKRPKDSDISWFAPAIDELRARHRMNRTHSGDLCANITLIQSEDMLKILNARGTVLLNSAFFGLPEISEIVALAILAVHVFQGLVADASRLGA